MSMRTTITRRSIARLAGTALLVGSLVAAAVPPTTAQAGRPTIDVEPVTSIADGTPTGASVLRRTERGVRAVIWTGDLERRHAYTVWAVVFNHPEACDGPCDSSDLADPDVGGVSTLFTGKVARGARTVFVGNLRRGEALTDPLGAEIHLVVRTHGPAIRGSVHEQLTTLNGGCPPNTCANVQMAIHGR